MKRIIVATLMLIGLTAATVLAQMGGQEKEGAGSPQMAGGELMSSGMMTNMTDMMGQMDQMLEKLAHPMRHLTVADHKQLYDLGKVMRKMAAEMNELAAHMEKGEINEAAAKQMDKRMKAINQEIETIRKKSE